MLVLILNSTWSGSYGVGTRRFMLLCCIALTLVSVGCNRDSAQWKVAAATNERKSGDPEAAIELLQTALRMDPDSYSIKLQLADILAENDQGDLGLMLCDEVLESYPNNKQALWMRARCLRFLGRFDEALTDYQKYCADNIDKECCELNELAYYRGLAGLELDKALRQINKAIKKFEQQQYWGRFSYVPLDISSIVSAGLISRHTPDGHLFVMDLLNDMIFEEQQLWLQRNSRLQRLLDQQELESQNNASRDTDKRQAIFQAEEKIALDNMQMIAGNLVALLATRSLIFEDQGQSELADLDRLWLKRIGFEPQDIYNALPNDIECLTTMRSGAAILDTRGFILTQMPWQTTWTKPNGDVIRMGSKSRASFGSYRAAMRDLDIAVATAEVRRLAFSSDIVNRIERSIEEIHASKQEGAQIIAILRNHRRQANLKENQVEAAEQDLLRIKELGFEAGPNLF